MMQNKNISCHIEQDEISCNYHFTISVPHALTKSFFEYAMHNHQSIAETAGFKKGTTPLAYIQKHFKAPIINHLKEVALKFFGINSLLQKIREEKIVLVGTPKLTNMNIDENGNTTYHFKADKTKEFYMQSWKYLPFKAIPRKKYRDIDKQVKTFLDDEATQKQKYNTHKGIQVGDWVCFQAWLINHKNKKVFKDGYANVWLRIGNEEPDLAMQKLFVGKEVGDVFKTDLPCLQNYFCESSDNNYTYEIHIKDIVPQAYFSLDLFKQYFKIKTQKDLHNKLIEVFSFHHDISQRRLMAFEALGLIMRKNHIVLPDHAINQQKKSIIQEMQFKPDFMVYKMDPDFDHHISELAKKQLSDAVIAESIAYQDNLTISEHDIKGLLHLTQRPRIKDFIYFPMVKSQNEGQEIPVDQETLHHACLKEKAVNHIIHHLTKK